MRVLSVFGIALSILMVCPFHVLADSRNGSPEWQSKMKELSQLLSRLTEDVSSDSAFNSVAGRGRIEHDTRKLSELAHELKETQKSNGSIDPSMKMMAGLFQEQATLAHVAFKSGNREYARHMISGLSSYCVSCHTRNASGPQFGSLDLSAPKQKLTLLEQGKFYTATRQFDRALELFRKTIGDSERPLESSRSVRYALAIAVRVKKDPDLALGIVDEVLKAPAAPSFLQDVATLWKESIVQWKQELPKIPKTEEGLFSEARRLTVLAHDQQRYPADHSSDILYLRASAVLHDLLQMAPEGRNTPQALLLLGLCYDALNPIVLSGLSELHYEACIRRAPGTPESLACFRRYEQNVYLGYTGSAGFVLPPAVQNKVNNLRRLATPIDFKVH